VPVGLGGALAPLQRFFCKTCGKSFTLGRDKARPGARFADDVVDEAVRLYVQGLPSYRVLSVLLERRLHRPVARITLNRWVDDAGGRSKTPLEVSSELAPRWGGFLGVDGKFITAGRKEASLLVGVDHPTQDVVHALVLPAENGEGFERLVREAVTGAGYPLRGIVTDLGPGFAQAYRAHFARVPFQACRIHFDRRLDQDIPKAKGTPNAAIYAELKDRIRAVLYAGTEEEARALLHALSAERGRFGGVGRVDSLRSVERNFGLYMAHHHTPGLPADNNVTENVIKQLGKKLRLMEGFASLESAERFCRLLIGCYRFKRFTDSCRSGHNGKAPLELAGVDLAGRDWLTFLLDR